MLTAYVWLRSATVTPDALTERLGVTPTATKWAGEPSSVIPGKANSTNQWEFALPPVAGMHHGAGGISHRLLELGDNFADQLRVLAGEGVLISLEIVQEIKAHEDDATLDLSLSSDVIVWLARANASVTIDQYLLP